MTTTYEIKVNGDVVATMGGDFAQASSPLTLDGNSTPYQVADAKHSVIGAAEMLLLWANNNASGSMVETDEDGDIIGELTVNEQIPADVAAMIAVIDWRGDSFSGSDVRETAEGWIEQGFDSDDASEWMDAGVWDAETAAELRDEEITPAQITQLDEDGEISYPDGCGSLGYALANCDVSVKRVKSALTAAAE